MFHDIIKLSDISRPQRDPNYPGSPTRTTIEFNTIAVVLLVLLSLPYYRTLSLTQWIHLPGDPYVVPVVVLYCILLLCTVTCTTSLYCNYHCSSV